MNMRNLINVHSNAMQERRKSKGDLIHCSDCRKYGYIALSEGQYEIPPNWRIVWAGLKPKYLCPDCLNKRRQWGKQFLK